MKIGSQRPGAPVSRAARATGAYAAAKSTVVSREIGDITSVMGIPAHELTPKVRAAIGELMEEVDSLRREVQIQRERADRNEKLADEDALLPVVNRRAFVRELSRNMTFAQRYGTPSSVLYFDVNNMKTVNDSFGHSAGDAVLREVAATLLDNIRNSDVVGRLGGDEFGVILAQADEDVAAREGGRTGRRYRRSSGLP